MSPFLLGQPYGSVILWPTRVRFLSRSFQPVPTFFSTISQLTLLHHAQCRCWTPARFTTAAVVVSSRPTYFPVWFVRHSFRRVGNCSHAPLLAWPTPLAMFYCPPSCLACIAVTSHVPTYPTTQLLYTSLLLAVFVELSTPLGLIP